MGPGTVSLPNSKENLCFELWGRLHGTCRNGFSCLLVFSIWPCHGRNSRSLKYFGHCPLEWIGLPPIPVIITFSCRSRSGVDQVVLIYFVSKLFAISKVAQSSNSMDPNISHSQLSLDGAKLKKTGLSAGRLRARRPNGYEGYNYSYF